MSKVQVLNNSLLLIDPLGLFQWGAFGMGLLDGGVGMIASLLIGGAIVAVTPAAALPAVAVLGAFAGGFFLGIDIYEAWTNKDWWTGKKLCCGERERVYGRLVFQLASLWFAKTKWFNKGAEKDMEWVRRPPKSRMRDDWGKIPLNDQKWNEVGHLSPKDRAIRITDYSIQGLKKAIPKGAAPGWRVVWRFSLLGPKVGEEIIECMD